MTDKVAPLYRVQKNAEGKKSWKQVNVSDETHAKLKELVEREHTTQVDLLRYLIDLAYAGQINLGGE